MARSLNLTLSIVSTAIQPAADRGENTWSHHTCTSERKGVETLFLILNNYYNKSLRFCAAIVARRLFCHCRLNIIWLMDVRESLVSGTSGDIFSSPRGCGSVFYLSGPSPPTRPLFHLCPPDASRRRPTPSLLAWPARWLKNINRQVVTNRPVSCEILSFVYYHIAYLL